MLSNGSSGVYPISITLKKTGNSTVTYRFSYGYPSTGFMGIVTPPTQIMSPGGNYDCSCTIL